MKRIFFLLLAVFLLTGCANPIIKRPDQINTSATGNTEAKPTVGFITEGEQTFYVKEDDTRHTGWLELNSTRYYLNDQGVLQTGWLKLDGQTYYLKEDGSITRGKATINDRTYFFTSTGVSVIMANPWNLIPSDYQPELVTAEYDYIVDASCKDDLLQMLSDCRKEGLNPRITSAYRRHSTQIELYNNKVYYYLDLGYSEEAARKEASTIIAVPGTSEHELGLAVDLVDANYWVLDEAQEKTAAQKWLMEHSWEYGFILRYPNNKSDVTGIIYEPWHYRYVGKELANELHESGLCLEEYFAALS